MAASTDSNGSDLELVGKLELIKTLLTEKSAKKLVNLFQFLKKVAIFVFAHGERSQVVKAADCGSATRGFESPRSPFWVL